MEVKTLNGAGAVFEFTLGNVIPPINWEVGIFVDNISTNSLKLQKNVNPNQAGTPNWKDMGTSFNVTTNGQTTLKLVGGGHFKLVPNSAPVNILVALSY